MAKEVIYFSKKGLSARDALVNEANLWGNTFFTTALLKNGKIIFWDQHRTRLDLSLKFAWNIEDTKNILDEVQVAMASIMDEFKEVESAYLRISFYRELGGSIEYWIWALEKEQIKTQLKIESKCYHPDQNFPAFFKRSDYQFQFRLRAQAIENGYDDVLLLDTDSYILELPTSNIIFCRDNKYFTPLAENKILEGITLERIEHMLKDEGCALIRQRIHLDELKSFDSCISTSSFNGIRNISLIDEVIYQEDNSIIERVKKYYGEIW